MLAEVSLTRAEPADAWFAVRAASTQQVVAALQEVRGWLISTHASESYVEGRVEGGSVEVARVETEPVLPHRTRFRVFSPRRETTPVGAGFTIARSAAMQPMVAPADVAPARPIYTAPPMPVLPMPAHPAPIPQPEVHSVEPSRPVLPSAQAPLEIPVAAPIAIAPAPTLASITVEPVTEMHHPALVKAVYQPDMIAVEGRPGGAVPLVAHLTLVVYPFHSFVALNEFPGRDPSDSGRHRYPCPPVLSWHPPPRGGLRRRHPVGGAAAGSPRLPLAGGVRESSGDRTAPGRHRCVDGRGR